jgi:hypothetical protein
MERGRDFLREQVEHAAAQHRVLVENIESDKDSADDARVRDLCARHLPRLREHQVMLESYHDSLGRAGGGGRGGTVMEAVGSAIGRARQAVSGMREDDFDRLTDDLASIGQLQDTFSLFANVGDRLNEPRLAELGRHGERDHNQMQRDFYDLAQTIFVEQASMESGGGRAAAD